MSYRKAARGIICGCIIFAFGGFPGAWSQQVKKLIPPVEGQAKARSESQDKTNSPQNQPIGSPIPTKLDIRGSLYIHSENSQNGANTESSKWLDPGILFNFFLVVVGGFQAYFIWITFKASKLNARATVRAARTARHTLRTLDRTAERQLRAYVLVEKAVITNIEAGQSPTAKITFRNSGQTPAKNLKQWSNIGYDTFPHTVAPPTKWDDSISKHPLAPDGKLFAMPTYKPVLTELHMSELQAGTAALYVIGEIRYEDAFGNPRYTKYWLFAGGPIGIDSGAMASYNEGNEYD